jgi:GDP-L-fucose synthase
MAGSAICRALQRAGYTQLLTASREELDLLDGPAVERWFAEHKPTVVVLAAAKVGGIHANNIYPADFLLENLKIQNHVIETAWRSGVRRLLFLGSSCIYPKFAEQPIREEALLTGPLEPTNLYGPGDNYHTENSHVLPALIRRFHEAAQTNAPSVTCWGSALPLREFLHVDDLGEACVFALERWQPSPDELQFLNVGTGVDLSIRELAEAVAQATGSTGAIHWDPSKPDGTPKQQLDVIPVNEGLVSTVADFASQSSTRL